MGPRYPPTSPTSGTRATPAATLALPVDHVQLPSVKHQTTSVSLGKGRIENNLNYLNICNFPLTTLSYFDLSSRLDFQTMTGYTATVNGVCTDKFDATGQTGQDPPTICGTNTGYHSKIIVLLCLNTFIFPIPQVYVEFGATSSDTIEVKTTYGAAGSKQWNILARQIACTDKWK